MYINNYNLIAESINKYYDKLLFISDKNKKYFYSDIKLIEKEFYNFNLKRKVIITIIENEFGGLLGYLHFLYIGAIPMMVSSSNNIEMIKELILKYKPNYIFSKPDIQHKLNINLGMEIESYFLSKISDYPIKAYDELALLLPTSGSTGSPKYVRISNKNIFSNSSSITKYLKIKSEDIPITTLPPSYTYGLSILHSHIQMGCKIVVNNYSFFEKKFWNLIQDSKTTTFGGVPYHYEILSKLKFTKMNLPHLKVLTQAGGKMSIELIKEFTNFCDINNKDFFVMYGQTEATARMSYFKTNENSEKIGSIGKSIPDGTFELKDIEGNIIKENNLSGELCFIGQNVSLGYAYNNNDLKKSDENKKFLNTGDIAIRDNDGFYFIVGRKKRFIKITGRRINLMEIENILMKNNIKCICSGKDDNLEIYLQNKYKDSLIEIKKIIVNLFSIQLNFVKFFRIDEIPRNSNGKVSYHLLNEAIKEEL